MSGERWPKWIDDTPKHWKRKRLKHVCSRYADYGLNEPATSYVSEGVRFIRTSDIDDSGFLQSEGVYLPEELTIGAELQDGDVLLSRSGTIGRSFRFRSDEHGRCAFAGYLIRYRPSKELSPDFAFYFTKSSPFSSWINDSVIAATIGNVNGQKFANTPISIPPIDEQTRIVALLDKKTRVIDALIEKKKTLLELLEEKRLAAITQAVTKGLHPKVRMRDSGIEWYGQVPAHWKLEHLKYSSSVYDCKHVTPTYADEGVPLVSTSEVKPFALAFNAARQVGEDDFLNMTEGGRLPKLDDIIYSRNVSVGSAARVTENVQFCMGQDLCLIRPTDLCSAFFEFALNSKAVIGQIDSLIVGATFKRINVDRIRNYWIALPPQDEQHEIVSHLRQVTARLQEVASTVGTAIRCLQEYRSALITNAVTGKINMCDLENKEAAA